MSMTNLVKDLLDEKGYLLADGAIGTNLFDVGLTSGDAPELWNVDQPDKIRQLHHSFINAGSDIILTNSFGANSYRLKLHNAEDRVFELNKIAASLAKQEAQKQDRAVIIAGSMGPTGELIEPLGELTIHACKEAFYQQAQGLIAGGADVLWLETFSAQDELEAAIEGALKTGHPVVATLSLDTNGRTMMGLTPNQIVDICNEKELTAFGTNCGLGASEVVAAIVTASEHNAKYPLVAKANCGIPEFVDGKIRYNGTPELMANYAVMARNAGAKIIGGCCGTTAKHIAKMRKALDDQPIGSKPDFQEIENSLGEITSGAKLCHSQPDDSSVNQSAQKTRRRRRRS